METQTNGLLDWQEQVLAMHSSELDEYTFRFGDEIPLKEKQKEMLEWALSDDYFILRESDREVLRRVYYRGYYYEEDRVALNWIRENIMIRLHFIK